VDYKAVELWYFLPCDRQTFVSPAASEEQGVGGNRVKKKRRTLNIPVQCTGKLLGDVQGFATIFCGNGTWL